MLSYREEIADDIPGLSVLLDYVFDEDGMT